MTDSLYDRQSRTYGLDATSKLLTSTVYIIGLKNGYASEICKNLSLSGVNIILVGDEVIDEDDKINCMFYRKASIGSYCWQAIQKYINISHSSNINNINNINNSCVIVINKRFDEALQLNKFIRFRNSKMVYMVASGLAGSIFVDANVNHQVYDLTGEAKETVVIKDIINDKIICNKHNFTFGDRIKLINLVGDNLEYYNDEFMVMDTNNHSITISKNLKWENQANIKFINGCIEYIKTRKIFNHFEMDYKDSSDTYKKINSMLSNNITFQPVISIMGGFVSNEAIKLLTNKYTPIDQWFDWSDNIDNIDNINNINNLNKNIVMVGCGALGCEWLKNLTMMGFKNITIIDPDHIEKSNLSRQFLFGNEDIGKSKCHTAIKRIKEIVDDNINLIGYDRIISSEDINFTSNVFKEADIVISALDNIRARKYVDSICFDKCLPLFESGTMGMKGNTLPIIPYLTETYSNNNTDSDENQNEFPACTIKNFPNCIQHTIHWARDYFEELKKEQTDSTILCSKLFIDNINELLKQFPPNHMVDEQLFWSHGKLCPKVLDINDECCIKFIEATNKLNNINIDIDFDKDNDSHIEWITAASNCRATNYGIKNESTYTTKGIVGKIIPAVASTTSTVVGLIAIELLKYNNNSINDINNYRSWYLNMADNTMVYSEPNEMKPIIINGHKLNGWTKFKYNTDSLLKDFIDNYKELFKVKIEMVLYNSTIIHADFMDININRKISEIFNDLEIDIYKNEVSITLLTDNDIELPLINVLIL